MSLYRALSKKPVIPGLACIFKVLIWQNSPGLIQLFICRSIQVVLHMYVNQSNLIVLMNCCLSSHRKSIYTLKGDHNNINITF